MPWLSVSIHLHRTTNPVFQGRSCLAHPLFRSSFQFLPPFPSAVLPNYLQLILELSCLRDLSERMEFRSQRETERKQSSVGSVSSATMLAAAKAEYKSSCVALYIR